ncbi:MAG: hypothetical protein A3B47_02105 [Candidatus Levybacteria bacterium RIFCSPLOWO2_01_FULL_39_24]|nr:MAG: hypothetical protein A2800_01400 [Candidatus Levybacteria bacterium RIFCSPHIGHO2_01_FULL_40_16]OGH28672.1 MAG: hypothetical protein A3E12_00055 [Candidatus Levybacteria bacterium RIFCSPHIGHO2_12_FULL_39_9]OGH46434.1 MAG: hypothetical protein A3B47_02105 [Candidatus Levybacteria bacterium RIFCSPLOWO2_01_FULL_39_24]
MELMLTKKDIKQIMQGALREFFETLVLQYFEHNEKEHGEMKTILKSHDKRFDDLDSRFDSHDRDIDLIQRKLEKSEDDHEEIFNKLEKIDGHVQGQEIRISKLEDVASII